MQFISPAIKIAVAAFAVLLATAAVTLADVLDVREAEGMALAAGASATTTHAVLNANGAPPPAPPDCSTSLQSLINNAAAGSTLTLGNCTYRETVTVNKPLTLDGQGQASLRGSDVWSGFLPSSDNWVSSQSVPTLNTETRDICQSGSDERCKLPEQVYIDGSPLYQLATGSDPNPGQFALNGQRQVVLGSDPTGKSVEVTTRTRWLTAGASGVSVKGFDMRHCANLAQSGALTNAGFDNFTLSDSTLEYAHGTNVGFNDGANMLIENSRLLYAGQMGLGSYRSQIAIVGGEIAHNNTEDYDTAWEAGGFKLTNSPEGVAFPVLRVEGVNVHDNYGPGVWLDINADDALIKNNRVHDNLGPGIFFEISDNAQIVGNVAYNNAATQDSQWLGDAQIFISSSSNANVHDNVAAWGGDGITVVSEARGEWSNVTGVHVHHNTILRNDAHRHRAGLAWGQLYAGVMFDPASNNRGYENRYYYPWPEDGRSRFEWNGFHTTLASFNATLGEENGTYMTTAEKDGVVAQYNLPDPTR